VIKWLHQTDAVTYYFNASHRIDQFFIKCSFGYYKLNCDELVDLTVISGDSVCFAVNGRKANKILDGKELYSNRPGPEFGLTLQINIDQDEYSSQVRTNGAGIKVCFCHILLQNGLKGLISNFPNMFYICL
jgi:hypothetical protein